MRIHHLAMLALLAVAVSTGCGAARDVSEANTHSNVYGCDQCHGYPPPPHFPQYAAEGFPHASVTPAMCTYCHPATVLADGHSINGTTITDSTGTHIAHRDGQVEWVTMAQIASCTACHAAPPNTGRHLYHTQTRGVACATCHKGFDPETYAENEAVHMRGLDYIVIDDGTTAGYQLKKQADKNGTWPDPECDECHHHVVSADK